MGRRGRKLVPVAVVARPCPRRGHHPPDHAAAPARHGVTAARPPRHIGDSRQWCGPPDVAWRCPRSQRGLGGAGRVPSPLSIATERSHRRCATGVVVGCRGNRRHADPRGPRRRHGQHRRSAPVAVDRRHVWVRDRHRHTGDIGRHRSPHPPGRLRQRDDLRGVLGVHRRPVEGRHGLHQPAPVGTHRRHLLPRRAGTADVALLVLRRHRRRIDLGRRLQDRRPDARDQNRLCSTCCRRSPYPASTSAMAPT